MRFKYYSTSLRQMKFNKSFVLFFMIVITVLIITSSIYKNSLKPTLKSLSETSVKTLAQKSCNIAVKNSIEGTTYEDLIKTEKDSNGKITSLTANVEKMNKISNDVVMNTQAELEKSSKNYVEVPLGSFIGLNIFNGHGIRIKLNTIPTGICNATFKSTFDKAGINQTRHRILLLVTTQIRTIAPFFTDIEEYTNEIIVAETIIVGDTPTTYYDIQGINDLQGKDTLDTIQNN